jgi:hypothetical protein
MKRVALAMAAGVILLAVSPGLSLAVPPGTLDQSQDTGTATMSTTADMFQTFTVGLSGQLTGVQVYMNGDGTHSATVAIQATSGGDPTLTDLQVATAVIPPAAGFVDFVFGSPVAVTTGDVMALRINTGSSAAAWGSSADSYANGEAMMINGGWAAIDGLADFRFQTFVQVSTQPTAARTSTPPPTAASAGGSGEGDTSIWLLPFGLAAFAGASLFVARRRPRPIR